MIEFRTLGRIDLTSADGRPLQQLLAQPKRIALLAYLAAARPRGFHRRDTLLGIFWPEHDDDHARAALRKAVFMLRQALGEGVVVGRGDDELGIAPHTLRCDAVELDEACARGDYEAAANLYAGDFLTGFYISDTSNFEQWQERERAYLRARAFDAAWSTAERAERTGDGFAAAHWARRAAALVPADEAALRRLITLLDRLGDRAGALAAYDDFARRLAQEFEVEPAAETIDLVHTIRARAVPAPQTNAPAIEAPPIGTTRPRASRARGLAAVLGAAVLLTAVGARAVWTRGTANSETLSVAIMPFAVRGGPDLQYLGSGMVDLLSTKLAGAGRLHIIDPTAVLASVKTYPAPDVAREVAARFGARRYLLGSIVEAGGTLQIRASLYIDTLNTALAEATVQGSATELLQLVDKVAAQLVSRTDLGAGGRLPKLAALTTDSIEALKAFLRGESEFRLGRWDSAYAAMDRAIAADSQFALAHYRLAVISGFSHPGERERRVVAAQAARALSSRLSERERLLIQAYDDWQHGKVVAAERQYRLILARYPDELEAAAQLGDLLFHHGPIFGRPITAALPIFKRVLAIDSTEGESLTHTIDLAALQRDYVRFDSLVKAIQPGASLSAWGNTARAFSRGDALSRRQASDAIATASDIKAAVAVSHMLFLLDDLSVVEQLAGLLTQPERTADARGLGHILLGEIALARGQLRAAKRAFQAAEAFDPHRSLQHRALFSLLPFVATSTAELQQLRAELQRGQRRPATARQIHDEMFAIDDPIRDQIYAYLDGLLAARLGDITSATQRADELDRMPDVDKNTGVPRHFARVIRAELARLRGEPNAALELYATDSFGSASDVSWTPFYAQLYERYMRAELLRTQRPLEAAQWYNSFLSHCAPAAVLFAPAELRQAEIAAALGNTQSAAQHYARFAWLWRDADPELQPLVREAKRKATQLAR